MESGKYLEDFFFPLQVTQYSVVAYLNLLQETLYSENISLRFSNNSDMCTSEFQNNLKKCVLVITYILMSLLSNP